MTEKYGKEAYKIVLDLEVMISNFQSKLSSLISQTQEIQSFVDSFDPNTPSNLQDEILELSQLVEGLSDQQTSTSQQVLELSQQTQDLASAVLNLQTSVSQKANQSELANYVPVSRKINNKPLSADISLTFQDVGLQEFVENEVDYYYEN